MEQRIVEPFIDLAANRPGQAVIARADELYAQWRAQSFLRRLTARRQDRTWRRGGAGEVLVAKRMTKLGGAYRVLHAVPIGTHGSDIDHLVIGPTGVFTLNTESHRGRNVWVAGNTVMVDGHRQRHVRNSRFEAQRRVRAGVASPVGRLLDVLVRRAKSRGGDSLRQRADSFSGYDDPRPAA